MDEKKDEEVLNEDTDRTDRAADESSGKPEPAEEAVGEKAEEPEAAGEKSPGGEDSDAAAKEEAPDQDDVKDAEWQVDDSEKKSLFGRKKKDDKKDQQIEELTDRVQRQMAEFDNFRKRSDKEKAAMFEMGAKSVLEKFLPIVDNFERGLDGLDDEKKEDAFAQGMEKVYKQMTAALESLGVTPIEAVGQPFDPNYHNAVMHVEDEDADENIVVEEFQKGYLYRDSVLRHSMVKVAN